MKTKRLAGCLGLARLGARGYRLGAWGYRLGGRGYGWVYGAMAGCTGLQAGCTGLWLGVRGYGWVYGVMAGCMGLHLVVGTAVEQCQQPLDRPRRLGLRYIHDEGRVSMLRLVR